MVLDSFEEEKEKVSRKWMIENKMGERHALTASLEFASLAAFNRAPLLHVICNTNLLINKVQGYHNLWVQWSCLDHQLHDQPAGRGGGNQW